MENKGLSHFEIVEEFCSRFIVARPSREQTWEEFKRQLRDDLGLYGIFLVWEFHVGTQLWRLHPRETIPFPANEHYSQGYYSVKIDSVGYRIPAERVLRRVSSVPISRSDS